VHAIPLIFAARRAKQWELPQQHIEPQYIGNSSHKWPQELVTLARIGEVVSSMGAVNLTSLRDATIGRLCWMGVIHSHFRVDHAWLTKWFQRTPLGQWLVNAPCGLDGLSAGDWIPGLLWRHRRRQAVRWMLLWASLNWCSSSEAEQELLRTTQVSADNSDYSSSFDLGPPEPLLNAITSCRTYIELMASLGARRSDIVRWFERFPDIRKRWNDYRRGHPIG
jgi:hypothetical protein